MDKIDFLWKDRKRPIFGLPLSFTRYWLNEDKLLITTGIFSLKEEEIMLYRILDITLKRSFLQRIFNVGTIHCCSSDKTTKEFDIVDVKNPKKVKELLSDQIEAAREKKRVSSREYMYSADHGVDTDDYDDDEDDDDVH